MIEICDDCEGVGGYHKPSCSKYDIDEPLEGGSWT